MAVYGTLKRGFGNNVLIKKAEMPFIGEATTLDPEFIMKASGVPFVYNDVPQDFGERVRVEIFSFDTYEQIKHIDNLEGHPDWYQRKPYDFVLDDGELVTAEMYIIPRTTLEVSTLLSSKDRFNHAISRDETGKIVGWNYVFGQ